MFLFTNRDKYYNRESICDDSVFIQISRGRSPIKMNVLLNNFPPELIDGVLGYLDAKSILNMFIGIRRDPQSLYIQSYMYDYIKDKYIQGYISYNDVILTGNMYLVKSIVEWGFRDYNKGMVIATSINSRELIELFMSKTVFSYDECVVEAARINSLPLINLFIRRGAQNFGEASKVSISTNNISLVYFFAEKEDWDDFNIEGLIEAAKINSPVLVNFFIKRGANDWNWAMSSAASGGHISMIEFFIEKGANDWNQGMIDAVIYGSFPLVEFFVSKGADDWNEGMKYAASGGHISMVEFFINKGADDWNEGMIAATKGNSLELVKLFVSKGADDWNEGMIAAVRLRSFPMVEFFVSKGADDWTKGIKIAACINYHSHSLDFVRFFLGKLRQKETNDGRLKHVNEIRSIFTKFLPVLELLVENGVYEKYIDSGVVNAIKLNSLRLIKIIIGDKQCDKKCNEWMIEAVQLDYIDIVEYFVSKGADAYKKGFVQAIRFNSLSCVKLFAEKLDIEKFCKKKQEKYMVETIRCNPRSISIAEFFYRKGSKTVRRVYTCSRD